MSHVNRADEILVSRLRDTCAEIDRLRAELAECQRAWHAQVNAELRPAEAAIARVRELCKPGSPLRAAGLAEQVLRALDGGTG